MALLIIEALVMKSGIPAGASEWNVGVVDPVLPISVDIVSRVIESMMVANLFWYVSASPK